MLTSSTMSAEAAVAHPLSGRRGRPGRRSIRAVGTIAVCLGAAAACVLLGFGIPSVGGRAEAPSAARWHGSARKGLLGLPLGAQGPVSEALGADSPAYRLAASGAGFAGTNPAQRLTSDFTSAGVSVRSGTMTVALRLVGMGYGSSLHRVGAVAPRLSANRIRYEHRGVSEWYANGPLGLEQGFTLTSAPRVHAPGPLVLAIAIGGNAHASLGGNGRSVRFDGAGTGSLRYGGLVVTDATGRRLPSWLSLASGRVLVRVEASDARYPLHIDPFVQSGEKLTASGESGRGEFGSYGVALSANGQTALVGSFGDNGGVGAAYVFTRSGETWTQQGPKLTGGGEVGAAEFGVSVALSGNGETALVGGRADNGKLGAAWVFTLSGETWTQQGPKLTGAEEVGEGEFGEGVALSEDGNTALVGGWDDDGGVGAAWVFERSGGKWTQWGPKLTGSGETGSGSLGTWVALSGDGKTAIAGAPCDGWIGSKPKCVGAAFVFTLSGGEWTQQGAKLTGAEESGAGRFGESVALSETGETAMIGAPDDNKDVGAAWVFTRSGETWTQQGPKLTGSGEVGEGELGLTVALSSSGNTALAGARGDNGDVGATFVFTLSGGKWTQKGAKLTGGGESGKGEFGSGVALSANGETALIGGFFDDEGIGAAWVFVTNRTAKTEAASEVRPATATLNATVDPNGEEVTSCTFEYGTTVSYGSSIACSPSPGAGESPVAVSASLTGLSTNTTYHFRVVATTGLGNADGDDRSLTTLATSATGSTSEPSVPARAIDGALSVEATGGTGSVTVGQYGSDIGGAPLSGASGRYIDLYRSVGASFTKIEYKDCELGGAKSLWWDNVATGWEPISPRVAVYSEGSPPCITVTATESTTPSVAQLEDPRHVGGPVGAEEYGKCEPAKHGFYKEDACLTLYTKNGKAEDKGKYEWFPDPVACVPKKDGRYADETCAKLDEKKGKPKGKFEKANNSFTGASGPAKFEIHDAGALECEASTASGVLEAPKVWTETIIFTGCTHESSKCASAAQPPGVIITYPLASVTYEEEEKVFAGLTGDPIMRFSCAGTEFTLSGAVSGEASGDVNRMSNTGETIFKQGVGEETLETEDSLGAFETALTMTSVLTAAEALEINTVASKSIT